MRRRADFITMDEEDEAVALDGSKRIARKNSIHSVPVLVSFGVIAVLLGLYILVYTIDNTLPQPLNIADEQTHPDAFITERARHDLKLLTGLGPRVAGGYTNEVLTVDFLKREINVILQRAHTNQRIEFDVQVVSGSHYIEYNPHGDGEMLPYANVQNIVVKLYGANNASHSVLINSHFDSVPTSPGGSDDGINVVVMLEILRKLSREPKTPLNNVIFLFNGAEETGLQGAHGFITQHKWASECKVVLNLEACGVGGKMVLFQSGPNAPWLLKYYSQVPHPYGQAAGEEVFQNNLIPSDTDFRIFRDYGYTVGFDMAFFKNGYRYHTKYDDFEHIPHGSFQHAGDNALFLAKSLANAPEVANPKDNPGKVVFYDYLGFCMISYSETTAFIVNSATVLFSFVVFGLNIHSFKLGQNQQTIKYLISTFGAIFGGWAAAAIFIAITAYVIDLIECSMSWYANPWIIFGLYVTPTVALSSIFLPLIRHQKLSQNVKAQVQAHSVRIIWTVILFLGTMAKVRAVYALLFPVFLNALGFMVIYIFKQQHTVRKWQIIYVVSLVIPTIFLMYTSLLTLAMFVPVSGRIGSDKNSDLTIGLLSMFFTIVITSPLVAISTLVRKYKYLVSFLTLVFVISFIVMFTPLGFPYSGNRESPAPERYWVIHNRRIIHDEKGVEIKRDSGYFLLNMDRNSPRFVKDSVKDIGNARSLSEDCKRYLLCGLPPVYWKMVQIAEYSTWIPAGQPILPEPIKLDVVSKKKIGPNIFSYSLSITGPNRMGIYFSPKSGVKLLNISLVDEVPKDTTIWNGRDLYFITYIYGKEQAPLQFTFDVQVPNNISDMTTEIAISGIFVHDEKNRKTTQYVEFLNGFPNWTHVIAWLSSYESWWI